MAKQPISMLGFGSIPKEKRAVVVKDGVRRINGRQVDLLHRIAVEYSWSEDKLLAIIQHHCAAVVITKVADCIDGEPMQDVVAHLKGRRNLV